MLNLLVLSFQSFHSGSLRRGGVRHAIATRPEADYNDDWDAEPVESRRSSAGGQGPGLGPIPAQRQAEPVPQPRTITVQPLRHTPGLHEGQRVRPADLETGQHVVSFLDGNLEYLKFVFFINSLLLASTSPTLVYLPYSTGCPTLQRSGSWIPFQERRTASASNRPKTKRQERRKSSKEWKKPQISLVC